MTKLQFDVVNKFLTILQILKDLIFFSFKRQINGVQEFITSFCVLKIKFEGTSI